MQKVDMEFMKQFTKQRLHLASIWLLILMQMLNWSTAYRAFLYMNIVFIILSVVSDARNRTLTMPKPLVWSFAILSGFVILHFSAVGFVFVKEIKLIALACSISIGLWVIAKNKDHFIERNLVNLIVVLLLAYTVIEMLAVFIFHMPYGTTRNPHYLAQYCVLSIPVAAFCLNKVQIRTKLLLSVAILLLGYLLLMTSSRPAWIALIVSSLISIMFISRHNFKRYVVILICVPLILFMFNIGNFGSRFTELAQHITTEERVAIWHDDWKMQQTSNNKEWLVGHGLQSFFGDFKPYSTYHLSSIDYNSPHNHILEILYTSGILGLVCFILLYITLYYYLIHSIREKENVYGNITTLILMLFTINTIFVSITIPFFRSYTLNIIALVIGSLLMINEFRVRK